MITHTVAQLSHDLSLVSLQQVSNIIFIAKLLLIRKRFENMRINKLKNYL